MIEIERLEFERLRDFMEFQKLCLDLLQAEGCKNVIGLGKGPDQGSDITIDVPITSPIGYHLKKFIVQCKWYKPEKSVGENEIGNIVDYLSLHNADGLLMITSSQFTGTALNKYRAVNNSNRYPYEVVLWDCHELTKRLRKFPEIISNYFYSKQPPSDNAQHSFRQKRYNEDDFLKRYGSPKVYKDYTINSFPITESNRDYVEELRLFASEFEETPPPITLIDGALGSGKSGYAWSLLNRAAQKGTKVAGIGSLDYTNAHGL